MKERLLKEAASPGVFFLEKLSKQLTGQSTSVVNEWVFCPRQPAATDSNDRGLMLFSSRVDLKLISLHPIHTTNLLGAQAFGIHL